ncbi:MAG TPA: BatD family protein [Chiayiivirga sp.]|nr:BatD family protein [Chiayiivirga sp.]
MSSGEGKVIATRWLALVLLLVCGMLSARASAEVRAWFDRSSVSMGETVTLNIESATTEQPDFSALEKDFRISARSTNTQVQIINGAMARTNLWAVALEPLHEGVIAVAPITVGNDQTAPLSLTVRPMARGSAAAGDDVFLEVEADTTTPYVQQQVSYTVRLYYAVSLLEGNLDDPTGAGLQVRRVGEDVNYSRQIGGRRFNVVERRYAISADHSGSTTINAVSFRGRVAAGGRGGFFSQGSPVSTGSEAITLEVRPVPAQAPLPWTPAQALRLSDNASQLPANVNVGDALELTVTAEATGLSAEQLPELSLPAIAGAEVYPDQETRDTAIVDGKLVGKRTRTFAILPQQPGTLNLPERSLSWWNLATDQAQRSVLPARSITVAAAAGAGSSTPAPALPAADSSQAATRAPAQTEPVASPGVWRPLAMVLAVLWLATLLIWFVRAKRLRPASPDAPALESVKLWRPALAHALARNDLSAARRALLRLNPQSGDLHDLAELLEDSEQVAALQALEHALYRGDSAEGVAAQLRNAFARTPKLRSASAASRSEAPKLAPLYPES